MIEFKVGDPVWYWDCSKCIVKSQPFVQYAYVEVHEPRYVVMSPATYILETLTYHTRLDAIKGNYVRYRNRLEACNKEHEECIQALVKLSQLLDEEKQK